MTSQEIPDAELDVMSCLWAGGALTAREVRETLNKRRPMTHASVCTLLRRLEEKRFVSREKSGQGKAFAYRALVAPQPTARRLISDLVERVFAGNGVALVASLLDAHPLKPNEIEDLQAMLDELKAKQPRSRKKKGNGS